jgi:hypothetical protein
MDVERWLRMINHLANISESKSTLKRHHASPSEPAENGERLIWLEPHVPRQAARPPRPQRELFRRHFALAEAEAESCLDSAYRG